MKARVLQAEARGGKIKTHKRFVMRLKKRRTHTRIVTHIHIWYTHTHHIVLYWTIDTDGRDVGVGGTTKFGDRGTNFLLQCFRCLIECIVAVFCCNWYR